MRQDASVTCQSVRLHQASPHTQVLSKLPWKVCAVNVPDKRETLSDIYMPNEDGGTITDSMED